MAIKQALGLSLLLFFLAFVGKVAADPLVSGGVLTSTISPVGDTDTHTFNAAVGDSFILAIGDTGGTSFAPWIRVFDPNGVEVESGSGGVAAFDEHRAVVPGIYTVVVSDGTSGSSQTGSYKLDFVKVPGSLTTPGGDEGGTLTSGIAHFGDITLADLDSYQFSAAVDDSFVVSIGDTGETSFAPWIRIFDPNGLEIESGSGGVAAFDEHRAAVAGTYTVVVSDGTSGSAQTGSYKLDFVKVPGPLTTPSGDEGGQLTSGSSHRGDITLADLDSYQFSAAVDDSFVVSIGDTGETSFAPWIRIFDPNGLEIESGAGGVAAFDEHRAVVAGTYTVVVSDGTSGSAQTGSYDLNFAKTPGNHVISAGDDGAVLRDGDVISAEITIGDLDVWVFGLGTGGEIFIEAEDIASTAFVPWIRLFDPSGLEVRSNSNSDTASITFEATIAGDYLAVVSDGTSGSAQTGEYQLRFSSNRDIPVTTLVSRSDDDPDNDGLNNSVDNCPNTPNPNQADTGGIDTLIPDGIGDVCQCGDMNGDGSVTNSDSVLIRRQLLDLSSPFNASLCDVNGDGNCTNSDSVVIRRAMLGLPPGVAQTCAATRQTNDIEPQ